MPLDLLKRSETGAALTATQHDTNFTAIETEVNGKAAATHSHPPAQITLAATDRLVGRSTAGGGPGEEITCTAFARSLLNDPDQATALGTLGAATAAQGAKADTALQPDANGQAVVDYTQPHVTSVTGTLTQAAHGGRPLLITGDVTVPVTNGFTALIRNKSGAARTVSPASGNLIHEGVTKASISLPDRREVSVHSDGTDVWCAGALA